MPDPTCSLCSAPIDANPGTLLCPSCEARQRAASTGPILVELEAFVPPDQACAVCGEELPDDCLCELDEEVD